MWRLGKLDSGGMDSVEDEDDTDVLMSKNLAAVQQWMQKVLNSWMPKKDAKGSCREEF